MVVSIARGTGAAGTAEFIDCCETSDPPAPLEVSGYSIKDPRTQRALSEEIDVRFDKVG